MNCCCSKARSPNHGAHNQSKCNKHVLLMHGMKEKVIPRILVKESLNLKFGCKDMAKRSYRDLFIISGSG
jgi:hypothetical protein